MSTQPVRAVQPEPIYFGPANSLFGVYHAALRPRTSPRAIVFCHPIGHEYFRVHRAFRNIAVSLSRLGFSVLRFDYYGTGDSHADPTSATLARWQDDIGAAIDEVKRRSGAPRASVVGLRLGASLAWLTSLRRSDFELLVLWEPVVSGSAYLDELRRVEYAWLTDPSRQAAPDTELQAQGLLGFPLGPALDRELRAVDLTADPLPASAHVVTLLATAASPMDPAWRQRLAAKYGGNSIGVLPSGADWSDQQTVHTAVYAPTAVQVLPALFDKVLV